MVDTGVAVPTPFGMGKGATFDFRFLQTYIVDLNLPWREPELSDDNVLCHVFCLWLSMNSATRVLSWDREFGMLRYNTTSVLYVSYLGLVYPMWIAPMIDATRIAVSVFCYTKLFNIR